MNILQGVVIGAVIGAASIAWSANPVITTMFTADPAALVYRDSLFLFTGHDEQTTGKTFLMRDWHVFSTENMVDYKDYGAVLSPSMFTWSSGNAFAGHAVEYQGKFYWFVALTHKTIKVGEGFAIGVAVADHPAGPWKDAIGSALITDNTPNSIELNIDPAIYIEGQERWLYWGSWSAARRVKLTSDLLHIDGAVQTVTTAGFFEAPWVHKFNGNYYLSYASGYPSTTNYAMSTSLSGPWAAKGVINALQTNSETNHQAIIQFRGHWFFIYHQGNLTNGGTYKRAVNLEYLYYKSDGSIVPIIRTNAGISSVDNKAIQDGIYRLKVHHSNLYMEDSAGAIHQSNLQQKDHQLWEVVVQNKTSHTYTLKNLGSGKYLTMNADTLLAAMGSRKDAQDFRIENASIAEGYFIFTDYAKDRVVDILNIATTAGAPAISWMRTGTANQKFHFEFVRNIQSTPIQTPADPVGVLGKWKQEGFDLKGRVRE